jgi:hypothetical protein
MTYAGAKRIGPLNRNICTVLRPNKSRTVLSGTPRWTKREAK